MQRRARSARPLPAPSTGGPATHETRDEGGQPAFRPRSPPPSASAWTPSSPPWRPSSPPRGPSSLSCPFCPSRPVRGDAGTPASLERRAARKKYVLGGARKARHFRSSPQQRASESVGGAGEAGGAGGPWPGDGCFTGCLCSAFGNGFEGLGLWVASAWKQWGPVPVPSALSSETSSRGLDTCCFRRHRARA